MVAEVKTCRKGLHAYDATLKKCPDCAKISRKQRYWKNRNAELLQNKKWRESNKKYVRAYRKKWHQQNKSYFQKWWNKNKEQGNLKREEWKRKNKHKLIESYNRRRALKLNAVPKWVDVVKIQNIYKEASVLTKTTGIQHHVDHIYPLTSKYMCGLHVHTNLQILTATENLSKGNRVWPGQLDCQKD